MAEYITDPSMIQKLEQAWEGMKQYASESPAQRQQAAAASQPTQFDPKEVQRQMATPGGTGNPAGATTYAGQSFPGDPRTEFMGGLRSGLGTALQVGSAAIPPLAATRMLPGMARATQALSQGGRVGGMAARALPAATEGAVAASGAAIGGGGMADVATAALMPTGVRAVHENMFRKAARATMGALTPDQLTVAAMKNVEKQYGPGFVASSLWENQIRPNNGLFVPATKTTQAISSFQFPIGQTIPEQTIAGRLMQITDKYAAQRMRGSQMNLPGSFPGQFGMGQATTTLGNMYDDMKQLDEVAAYASKSGFKNYASQIYDLKDKMLDDMVDAVPALKTARTAMYKEGNVRRLWDIMDSPKPAVEWTKLRDNSRFRRAFSKSEIDDITHTMEMMSNVGGGSHWLGKIIGHGMGALVGTALGSGLSAGSPTGAAIGGMTGALAPFILGEAMANAGGRAFLRGLMKKNPVGLTPAGANSLMQWWVAKRRAGNELAPEQIIE